MPLASGTRLGPYEILAPLGAGGMGEVYRARDTRLDRSVAVKVLPDELALNPERLRRFEREARAVAALNHPHILTVHDIGTHDGMPFVVTELLEGQTLREALPRVRTVKQVLTLAVQAAQGLAAAHRKGIVHRDVKPENLFVAAEGHVKVLDFGLAKQAAVPDGEPRPTVSDVTQDGVVLGTVAYMSPEQAQGLPLDTRSDVFSFGVVLYELLTRRHPFRKETAAATLGAILAAEPPAPAEIVPDVNRELEKIVLRCLRKDPDRRFQHMGDVALELEELAAELAAASGTSPRPKAQLARRSWLLGAGALLGLLGPAAALWLKVSSREAGPPTVVPLTSYPGSEMAPALSPDGRQVAFIWNGERRDNWDVYVQMIGTASPLRLTTDPAADRSPAWSPDGRQIAFRRRYGVYVVPALGGAERKVADLSARPPEYWSAQWQWSLAWTHDGKGLVLSEVGPEGHEGLVLVPVDQGEKRQLTSDPTGPHFNPALSADGRQLAYVSCRSTYACAVQVLRLGADLGPEGPARRLTERPMLIGGITWSPDGRSLIFSASPAGGNVPYLWRVNASGGDAAERIELAGSLAGSPSAAPGVGRIVFSRGNQDPDIWKVAPGGVPAPFIASTRLDNNPEFSPDGRRLAFCSYRPAADGTRLDVVEVFVADADGSNRMQLTQGPGREQCGPQWSPDGRQIAFDSQADDGGWDIFVVDSKGGAPRLLTPSSASENIPSWSRDGRFVYFASNRSGRFEIWRVPAAGGETHQITRDGGFRASESPDGKLLYYVKKEMGLQPLFVRPVAGGEERQVLDELRTRSFVVTEDGLYHFGLEGSADEAAPRRPVLRFLHLATGATREVARVETTLHTGLTVSPDRRTILFSALKPLNHDLVLIENFR